MEIEPIRKSLLPIVKVEVHHNTFRIGLNNIWKNLIPTLFPAEVSLKGLTFLHNKKRINLSSVNELYAQLRILRIANFRL